MFVETNKHREHRPQSKHKQVTRKKKRTVIKSHSHFFLVLAVVGPLSSQGVGSSLGSNLRVCCLHSGCTC